MKFSEKIAALRKVMQQHNIDAYLVPSADPHLSEYLPERFKSIAWLSGFTGSAGTLLITSDFAGLWTDSRYFVQANEQLAGTGVELMKLKVQNAPEYADWAAVTLKKGAVFAFDGRSASAALAQTLEDTLTPAGIEVRGDIDLPELVWENRPELPLEPAFLIDESLTGLSTVEKLSMIRQAMLDQFADYHVISTLDDLAWAVNIRGKDVHCNPVVLGFLLLSEDRAEVFIEQEKLSKEHIEQLATQGISLKAYDEIWNAVSTLPAGSKILLDPRRTCYELKKCVPSGVGIVAASNPSTLFKGEKTATEISHTRETMIRDGIALTKFFKWLEESLSAGAALSEISISETLREFRAQQKGFVGESFDTIAGYKQHGALPHYKATPESNSTLESDGLLLIDSGGQYWGGTTDITRVISLGNITEAEKTDYTLVLKGMIEGSTTIFPTGTRGYQIDAITRKPLWDYKRNYGHGTGHGVGFFLNVHEGPQVFNAAAIDIAIKPGMITSIEPGLYREGHYGIRIENLVLSEVLESNFFGEFMCFETLTLCYIATDLIDKSLLEQKHIDWLNTYHQTVFDKLSPHLSDEETNWLREKTKAI